MVTINLAYTAPINRPSQTPILTASQAWTALEQKVRHPSGFVPLIVHCEEVSSSPATADGSEPFTITRLVSFRGREDRPIKEVCKHYPPTRIDFVQEPGGSKIANYVSQGPSGEATDLFMTFAFEWRHPEVEGGSEEATRLEGEYKAVSFSVFGDWGGGLMLTWDRRPRRRSKGRLRRRGGWRARGRFRGWCVEGEGMGDGRLELYSRGKNKRLEWQSGILETNVGILVALSLS